MISVTHRTFNGAYENLFTTFNIPQLVREECPRDKPVLEFIEPVSITVEEPWNCWLTWNNRKINPFFAAAEVFWILSGDSSVDWITRFNKNMRSFSDDDRYYFNAAYGSRIRKYAFAELAVDQVDAVIKRLKEDRNTRRACMGLWHPIFDNRNSNDIACNNMVYFSIRDDKLHTTTVIRSNDFIWGTPYNMIQFQHLAMLVAGEYNRTAKGSESIERGSHTIIAINLHVYKELYNETLSRMHQGGLVTGFDQDFCNRQVSLGDFNKLYGYLNKFIGEVESGKLNWKGFCNLLEVISLYNMSYWDQLSVLPVLYLFWKDDKVDNDEIFGWIVLNMNPIFGWLVDDFRGGHEE